MQPCAPFQPPHGAIISPACCPHRLLQGGLGGGRVLHGGLQLSLKIALVPLEAQWQKTKCREFGECNRILELFEVQVNGVP